MPTGISSFFLCLPQVQIKINYLDYGKKFVLFYQI
jgi:hypothetical protein